MCYFWLRLQFFVLYLIKIQTSFPISIYEKSKQFDYLNQQRPLWILEDQVSSIERDISHISFTTTKKPRYPTYYFKYRHKKMLPETNYYQRALQPTSAPPMQLSLPTHYIYSGWKNYSQQTRFKPPKSHWRRQQPSSLSIPLSTQSYTPSMPTFDSVPNDIDAADDDIIPPIFVYNGPKGELIVNTMLSTKKYPMQEPIPGEILYPPIAPIFRPKPIVQHYRLPGHVQPINLTLIPFYAHEAIVPRFLYDYEKNAGYQAEAATVTATATSPTAVIYAAPKITSTTTTMSTPTTTLIETPKPTKKRRHKKAKHYTVYRTPNEVHWRPTEATLAEFTTPYPMVLASPLQNHRYSINKDDTVTTTMKPMMNFKLSYKDEDSNFQIIYVDESLEKPTIEHNMPTTLPKSKPLLSSQYSNDREYYAFPVYTLGKLLKRDNSVKSLTYSSHFSDKMASKKNPESNVDTWFIMNSRYKGHHTKDGFKRLSSKYVEASPAATNKPITEETAETTLETSLIRN